MGFNYMNAADLNALIQAAEERGEKRGYGRSKREDEQPIGAKEAAEYLGVREAVLGTGLLKGLYLIIKGVEGLTITSTI